MWDATAVILMHVGCGHGTFYKWLLGIVYCKIVLSRRYMEL
jgi:hypothetical protein